MDFTDQTVIDQIVAELPISNRMAVTRIIEELQRKQDGDKVQEKKIYAVWTNSDLTEGRGREYIDFYCEKEATARRLAKKNYVMGSDSRITAEKMFYLNGRWYAPGPNITSPTDADNAEEHRLEAERVAQLAKEKAIARAKELGLTEDELTALKG